MKSLTILGVLALFLLLVLPGAVSAGDSVTASGSIAQPAPVAAFTASSLYGVGPLSVTFTDASTVSLGTINSWKWEYNAGSGWVEFSTAQNPTYIFTVAGPYDIRLTVAAGGVSDDETKTHYIAVSTGREPLTTVQSGTVTGDLYVASYQPVGWANQPSSGVTSRDFDQSFTLPAAAAGNIQWAKVYVNTYMASASGSYGHVATVTFDKDGDATYETTLGVETCDLKTESNGNSYPLNDHVTKVYSDFEAQYDVTSLISAANPAVHVRTDQISGLTFDGRLKAVSLVVAYNDPASTTQTKYWVNHGQDYFSSSYGGDSGQTTFSTSSLGAGFISATGNNLGLSSKDGRYSFNTVSQSWADPVSPVNYFNFNTWNLKDEITAGADSTLIYTRGTGSSFKTTLSTIAVKYAAPTAAFSGTPLTGDTPLTVAFTDESTGAPTAWAWDFNNDGTTDSTAQSPSYTYDTPGIYTVKLTVSNALGSDEELKTNYVTVKTPAPTADFTYTPASGSAPLAVAFTSTSTGVINSYAWDFNNDGTTDSTDQNPSYTYTASGTYSVKLMVTGPDYSDEEVKSNIISVGVPVISVDITPAGIDFGSMAAGTDETGSTAVAVTTDGGTAWSVTGAASNGGYMGTGSANLAAPFQLANGSGSFQAMTSNFAGFMTGMANEDRTDTANVKQAIGTGDQPGSYSITLTFTGAFV